MKKFFLFGVAMFFVGCSTVIKVGDQIERAATPPDPKTPKPLINEK